MTNQNQNQNNFKPLLKIENLNISFGDKKVVHDFNLTLNAGEKLALVGESGSGKTVTALSLLRLAANASYEGKITLFLDQNSTKPNTDAVSLLSISEQKMQAIRGKEIAMIFQEPMTALNPLFTIGEQIAEVLMLKKGLSRQQAQPLIWERLRDVGLPDPKRCADSFAHQLSGGQRQRAMIAMALASEPRLLIADEPTTALDVTLRGQILDLLSDLQERAQMAVLLITHDLQSVKRFAKRVVVMENGHLVESGDIAQVLSAPKHVYTQKLLNSRPVRDVQEIEEVEKNQQNDLQKTEQETLSIHCENLNVAYPIALSGWRNWFKKGRFPAVKNAQFQLAKGQTLGIVGESGSGKSTLAQAVLGLLPFSGDLRIQGQSWSAKEKQRSLRRLIQVVFQDPFSSLSPRLTVLQIVGEGLEVHEPHLNAQEREARVLAALNDVGLSDAQHPQLLMRYPHEFSGGQRQRLAIARALIVNPSVLILDEPTSALDVTIQKQVLQLLQKLQRERGLSYLLITHDIAVIEAMAHHVLVMKNGEIVEAGKVDQVLKQPQTDYTRVLMQAALA